MRKIIVGLFLIAGFLFCAEAIRACSCVPPKSELARDPEKYVKHELDESGAVFSGKVLSITPIKPARGRPYAARIKFKVYKSWKGVTTKHTTAVTTVICCICGYSFEVGEEYLVYSQSDSPDYHVTMCSRTRRLDGAEEDLQFLGEAKTMNAPVKAAARPARRKNNRRR